MSDVWITVYMIILLFTIVGAAHVVNRYISIISIIFLLLLASILFIMPYFSPPTQVVIDPPEIVANLSSGDGPIVKIISIKNVGIELSGINATPHRYDATSPINHVYINYSLIDNNVSLTIQIQNMSINDKWLDITDPKDITFNTTDNRSVEVGSVDISSIGLAADAVWLNIGNLTKDNLTRDEVSFLMVTLNTKNMTWGEHRGYISITANTEINTRSRQNIEIGQIPVVLNIPKPSQTEPTSQKNSTRLQNALIAMGFLR